MIRKIWQFGPALIVTAAILWALDALIRRSLYILPPITIVFFEHLIGLIVISPFLLPRLKKDMPDLKTFRIILLVALLSGLLGTLWFTSALQAVNFIPFSVVLLLQKLQPIFAISAASIFLKEKIDRRYAKWAVLALISAYFVTFPNGLVNLSTGAGTLKAALLAVGAAFAWGSSTAFSRMALLKRSAVVVTGLRFFFTTIMALVAVFLLGAQNSLGSVNSSQILRFVFIALSTGMVALYIYYRGLKVTQAKITTLLELVFPVLGVYIDVFQFHTVLAPSQYLGALVLFFSIYRLSLLQKSATIVTD